MREGDGREPTGPELAARLRPLLPANARADFDNDISIFADADDRVSVCGVLMAMAWAFKRLVDARESRAIEAVLGEMERLLATFSRRSDVAIGLDDSVWNSVLVCFFESALPVVASEHAAVMAHLGPVSRAALEEDPWWLEPE